VTFFSGLRALTPSGWRCPTHNSTSPYRLLLLHIHSFNNVELVHLTVGGPEAPLLAGDGVGDALAIPSWIGVLDYVYWVVGRLVGLTGTGQFLLRFPRCMCYIILFLSAVKTGSFWEFWVGFPEGGVLHPMTGRKVHTVCWPWDDAEAAFWGIYSGG
jgi:hypothetical protein